METLASKVDRLNLSPMDSSRIRIIGLALDDPRTLPLKTKIRSLIVCVTGYDTSLSKIKIERALRQHFSSCGRLRDFDISKKFASAEFVTAVHTRRYRSIPNKRACKVQRC
ncbi:hypothetical protein YC2023_034117 [Brassica napus]